MFRIIRKGTLLAVLAAATWGGLSALAAPGSNSDNSSGGSYKPEQIIVLREKGKPDRKCLIVSTTKQKDGRLCYKVKALDNGEMLTICDRPAGEQPIVVPLSIAQIPTAGPIVPSPSIPANPTVKADQPVVVLNPQKLTATAAEASQTPPPKPPSKSLWARIFGPSSSTPQSSCQACQNGNPVPLIKPRPTTVTNAKPTTAQSGSVEPPPASAINTVNPSMLPPSVAPTTIQPPVAGPMPVGPTTTGIPGPLVPQLSPQPVPETVIVATPLPKYGQFPEENGDERKIAELKIALKGSIRPSEREIAAEHLIDSYRGDTPEIRSLLLVSAQQDPAPTVRLTCLRCLSKQGIKDQALMTTLVAAQKDRDPRVREEAAVCLERLALKK